MPDSLHDELADAIHDRIEQAVSDNYRAPDGTHPVNPSAVAAIATAAALAALAEAREEIEEDARVMRAWRRREALAEARAKEAEAALAPEYSPLVAWFAARPAKVDRLGRERLRRRILRDRWPAAAEVKTAYRRRRGNRRG